MSKRRQLEAHACNPTTRRTVRGIARATDSFGLVLLLVVLDYVAVSTSSGVGWSNVVTFTLHGFTLVVALHTSGAGRVWVSLASIGFVAGMAVSVLSALLPGHQETGYAISILGGVLLIVTPLTIVRRIATHRIVTAETLLGAVCVYVLLGFTFASLFAAIGFLSSVPFFAGVQHTTQSTYLFFSYTTLTTVGYGNLVPETDWGQTLAMLEAMLGQIYLVLGVARLVALWGQAKPRNAQPSDANADDA